MITKEEERKGVHGGKQEFGFRLKVTLYIQQNTVLPPAAHAAEKNIPYIRAEKCGHRRLKQEAKPTIIHAHMRHDTTQLDCTRNSRP